jgi:hypothetical protein
MFGLQGRVVAAITLRATIGRKRALLFALAPLVLVLVTVALKLPTRSVPRGPWTSSACSG